MILRRLEAYGFKSFADKTEIEFGPGITVVVGPNGSGKSNISDAIRWVLGEQSVRMLRGTKMEDVIFAGSAGRRALGIAEVSLTFDNSDGTLALDFNEVIITRRVFRSGDSEYYINKALCRLKDIYELLADTGLGRDAMTVIGQNKVDEILNSKPEERRLLFEEAAGISKYKQRKKEAMRKLEDTTQNLIRVSDITSEIQVQLVPLAESAERTTTYNKLQSELVACQITLLLNLLEKSEKMVESATLQKSHLTEQEVSLHATLSLKETGKIQLTADLVQADEQLSACTHSINQADTELERIQGKIAVLQERMNNGERSRGRITEEQGRIETQNQELEQKISSVQNLLTTKQQLAEKLTTLLAEKNELYQQLITDMQQTQEQLDTNKEKTFDYLHEIVGERNKVVTIERDLARIEVRQTNFEQESGEYKKQLAHIEMDRHNILTEQESIKITLTTLHHQKQSLTLAKQRKEEDLHQISTQEKRLLTEVNELTSRCKILSNMQNEYEGFARGIKSVLKSNAPWKKGICGAVAQVLKVPDKYVTAVEIALGGALQHIITENAEVGKQAMFFLKTQNLGRATFLPLDTIKPLRPRDGEIKAAKMPGSLGFAADLVSADPRYQLVLTYLLGRTIIAENIDVAMNIAKQQGFAVKIVTLDGEVLNPGGSMTGGSVNKRDSSFLSRSNAITTMQQDVGEKKVLLENVQKEVESTHKELLEINQKIMILEKDRQQIEVRQAEFAIHREKIEHDYKRINQAIITINNEKTICIEEMKQLTVALGQTQKNISNLEERDTEHQENLSSWQQKFEKVQATKEVLQANLIDIKIELTGIGQEITGIIANCEQYEQSKGLIQNQLVQLGVEHQELSQQLTLAQQELMATTEQHASLTEQKKQYEEQHKQQHVVKLTILTTLQEFEKELKELRRKSHDLQNRLHEIELLTTKYTYEVNNAHEKLEQQFSLTIEEAKALSLEDNATNITKRVRELERDISALGPVNHGALEEFTTLQGRYDFLEKQYQDLVEAKEYLSTIIIDIDKTMSAKFIIAFEKINEHFSDIFVKLFGGGQANLHLIDPENMLSTGIEIVVQPPGKKLQNLVLLSGGERTLTVIALLFSFLTYRPSPFIVVDEIDASLDETNVDRLSEFLQDYAKDTQFIVVTHRKGTMESANIIYGVTMEQSGVSRLVSVKLMDKTG